MKTQEYSSLGLVVPLSVPESVEEFNSLDVKRPNAVLIEATNNVVYRGGLAEFRSYFLYGRDANVEKGITAITECVQKISGVAPFEETVLDKEGKPVLKDGKEVTEYSESEAKYFKRVCATMKVEPEHFQSLANTIAGQITFDPAKAEPSIKGPRKLPQDIVDRATAMVNEGEARFAKVVKFIKKDLGEAYAYPTWTEDNAKNIQSLGETIKAHQAYLSKQRLAAY